MIRFSDFGRLGRDGKFSVGIDGKRRDEGSG